MKTVVITVGKEVLTGKTLNTNLMHIASRLNMIGIEVSRSFVIDDVFEEYTKMLEYTTEELIIFTGGLGPTIDDITRESVYHFYEVETYLDQNVLQTIKGYFDRTNRSMKNTNQKQALFPVNSIVLTNDLGTAPGVYFEAKNQKIVLLPGPPFEMIPMLEQVITILEKDMTDKVYSDGFKLVGTGESYMENELIEFYPKHPMVSIAPYAAAGEIKYVFSSKDPDKVTACMNDFKHKFSQYVYGKLEDTLEGVVVELLRQKQKTVSFAESCTGGLLASQIVNISGSSEVFKESFVTYSNEAKMKHLGVLPTVFESFGAVSNECAYSMVDGLIKTTNADYGISITGIAGPTGGSIEKPVGLVYFGVYANGKIHTYRQVFNGNREIIRKRATIYALNALRKVMLNE